MEANAKNSRIGFIAAGVLLVLQGCGGGDARPSAAPQGKLLDGGGGTAAAGGGGGGGGSAATSSSGGAGPKCPTPDPPAPGQAMMVDSIHASLVDQDGNPAAGVLCSACGVDVCGVPVKTDAQGSVTIWGPGVQQHDPRFNVAYEGRGFAKMVGLIPSPTHDFGVVRVLRLPEFSQGAPLVAGADATSGGVTLTPPADAQVSFDQILFTKSEQRFVAALLDIRALPPGELPAVDPSLGLELLIGTGPLDTEICPPAALGFDNLAGWPEGADIEIYMNGSRTYASYAPYGGWAAVADAVVDPGGATVCTKPGQGLALLGTFGAGPK